MLYYACWVQYRSTLLFIHIAPQNWVFFIIKYLVCFCMEHQGIWFWWATSLLTHLTNDFCFYKFGKGFHILLSLCIGQGLLYLYVTKDFLRSGIWNMEGDFGLRFIFVLPGGCTSVSAFPRLLSRWSSQRRWEALSSDEIMGFYVPGFLLHGYYVPDIYVDICEYSVALSSDEIMRFECVRLSILHGHCVPEIYVYFCGLFNCYVIPITICNNSFSFVSWSTYSLSKTMTLLAS